MKRVDVHLGETLQPRRILETCLYAEDLEAAERFYTGVLNLTVHQRDGDRHLFLRCGRQQMLLIFNPNRTNDPESAVPPHGATGAGHLAFGVTEGELNAWRSHLLARAVPIEREIDWPGGGRSLYFRDPAGNSLELATGTIWAIADGELLQGSS